MKKPRHQSEWKPNAIALTERVASVLLASILLLYGLSGLFTGGFSVSFTKGSAGLNITGRPAWLLAAAAFTSALVPLSVLLDHYDKRDNEVRYRTFRRFALSLGFALLGASLVSGFYVSLVR